MSNANATQPIDHQQKASKTIAFVARQSGYAAKYYLLEY